ncbi:sensor histidine kinase KdpD [Beijerinckia sp. L45]|uniref:sensor histidine kinase n=1 Tax=Beijerinckia sp. L45 TaxID=1641855 RepID=UPI00131C7E49|nr:ATP-binding protein [Beijerinckia sp. L45]
MLDLLRPSPFRLALTFAAAVSVSTLVGVGVTYRSISNTIETRREIIVADETAAVLEGNRDRIRKDLQSWLRNGLLLYSVAGLFEADGTPIAGNLNALPTNLTLDGKVHGIVLAEGMITGAPLSSNPLTALVSGTRRSDGTILVMGRTLSEIGDLRRALFDMVLFGLAGLLLVSLGYGLYANARQAARLKLIQRTFARIMEGALDERVPVSRRRDDLDRLAADVNRMLDMLGSLLAEVKGVGDNIAHDLRTPLSIARTRIERALASDADAPALRSTMAISLTELDRAFRTISALLRLAEIQNGQRRAGFRMLDLALVCRDAVDFYEPLADSRGIGLTLDVPAALPMRGDADLLAEVLNNLIDNAIKFSSAGSSVTVAARSDAETIAVSVADQGQGIPAHERDNVAKRFYRLDKSRHESGTGLGLSLVFAIAELHGFRVAMQDGLPHGTVVTMSRDIR